MGQIIKWQSNVGQKREVNVKEGKNRRVKKGKK
jgi:hypothetical protein